MRNDKASGQGNEYAWFSDDGMPHSRGDRIAEAFAVVALLFSVAIGLVIALLPASATAATAAEPSARAAGARRPSPVPPTCKIVPAARPGDSAHPVEATPADAGRPLEYPVMYCSTGADRVRTDAPPVATTVASH